MTIEAIKALVDLGPELLRIEKLGALEDVYFENVESSPRYVSATQLKTILAAIEAIKPMADVRTSVLLNDIRTIADTGGRRGETAMDACDKIVELIDMERQLGPAARA